MTQRPILLDTCAVIWLFNGAPLAQAARDAIANASAERQLFISSFSAWEVGMLVAKGKIALSMPPVSWFRRATDHPGVSLAPLTSELLIESSFLPGIPPGDPADRIIVTTAREHGHMIITRDRPILNYAGHGHVEALAC